jgi:hypothetical protein
MGSESGIWLEALRVDEYALPTALLGSAAGHPGRTLCSKRPQEWGKGFVEKRSGERVKG